MKHLSFHSYLRKMTAGMAKYVNNFTIDTIHVHIN
jgi:hypothetical protein